LLNVLYHIPIILSTATFCIKMTAVNGGREVIKLMACFDKAFLLSLLS